MLLDAYIRVSRVGGRAGERFISPAVQREQIEAWIRARGARLGEVFEELDQSGARRDRPLLIEAIARVEAGESAGIVVAKLDRFGRSLLDGLRAIQQIEAAGGIIVSVGDGLDPSTATGRLILQLLFSIAEWELERVRSNWEEAKARAIERGVYVGREPFGYRRDAAGRLRIDPRQGPIVREIFARRAAGESYQVIAHAIQRHGLRTSRGGPLDHAFVWKIVHNPAYRGEARHGPHRNPHAHPPLVDATLWQSCQSQPRPQGKKRSELLLAGMIRCAGCGRKMKAKVPNNVQRVRHHTYKCANGFGDCQAPAYARGDELDPLLEQFVFVRCSKAPGDTGGRRLAKREAALADAEAELAAYRDEPLLLSTLGPTSFAEGLAARQRQLEQRLAEMASARRAHRPPPLDVAALEASWPELSLDERRGAVCRLLDCVLIERGSGPLAERVWIFRQGRGAARGRAFGAAFSFDPRQAERAAPLRRIGASRLERELRAFTADHREWPTYLEFARAGKARLYAQAMDCGGLHFWAAKLDLRAPQNFVRWTPEAVESALRLFLAGRETWASKEEFEAAGLMPLYYAADKHGGFAHWAERFGLYYRKGHRYLWPPARMERELRRLAKGGSFPTCAQMREAGLNSLYLAVRREGGAAKWADRLGLTLEPQRKPRPPASTESALNARSSPASRPSA